MALNDSNRALSPGRYPSPGKVSPGRRRSLSPCPTARAGEQDWQDALERVDRFAEQLQEQSDVAKRVRQKDDLVSQLQQALSDSHSLLYEERARLLKLQQANDKHRLRVLEHERRIRSLQAHCRVHGCRHPECGGSKISDGLHPDPASPCSAPELPEGLEADDRLSPQTVIPVPAATAQALVERVEALQAQLMEQAGLAQQRAATLAEEKRLWRGEEAVRRETAASEIGALTQRLAQTQRVLHQTTKDYILAKRDRHVTFGQMRDMEAAHQQATQSAAQEEAGVRGKAAAEAAAARKLASAQSAELRAKLREQGLYLAELQDLHEAMRDAYENRLTEVEQQLSTASSQVQALEVRRALDMEGWANDVTILRRQLTATDRKLTQTRLATRLPDGERLEGLLTTLEQKAPDVDLSSRGEKHSPMLSASSHQGGLSADDELNRVHSGIQGLQTRLRKATARQWRASTETSSQSDKQTAK